MGAAIRDGIVALAGVIRAICRDAGDLFICGNLTEQIGQDRCVADVAPGDLPSRQICFANRLPGNGRP